jgi:hypothetical protein
VLRPSEPGQYRSDKITVHIKHRLYSAKSGGPLTRTGKNKLISVNVVKNTQRVIGQSTSRILMISRGPANNVLSLLSRRRIEAVKSFEGHTVCCPWRFPSSCRVCRPGWLESENRLGHPTRDTLKAIRVLLLKFIVQMSTTTIDPEKQASITPSIGRKDGEVIDLDTQKLQEMGYQQDMRRKYSVLSVLGVGFSLTNSWWAVSTAFVTGISSGGSALLVYGTILLFIVSIGVAVSLSELVSALPNAAGQSFWARELAPKRWSGVASYAAGWLVWAGSIFACASVASAVGSGCVGSYSLSHPDL